MDCLENRLTDFDGSVFAMSDGPLDRSANRVTAQEALMIGLEMADRIVTSLLADLSDEEMLHRPHPHANHIKWQLGHLISSEHEQIESIAPGSMPALPVGFADRYHRQFAAVDDPQHFDAAELLLHEYRRQRAGTQDALRSCTARQLGEASGIEYAPTVAAVFSMQASHSLMHAGQWSVIRRQLGRPPVY